MVLYSRLHLIVDSPKILRALLIVIVGVGVPLQIVMALAGDRVLDTNVWVVTFRLEMIFPFSEIILSSLYVYLFVRFMRQDTGAVDALMKRTFYFLIAAESFVVIMDVIGKSLWYMDLYLLRLAVLPFITALKLKVEFMILNRLTGIGKRKNKLRNVTVSVHEEREGVQVMSPHTFQSEAPTSRMEENRLGIVVDVRKDGLENEKVPADSARGLEASIGSGEHRGSLDEMDSRYLGRFGRSDIV